jgi:hypothetical protein
VVEQATATGNTAPDEDEELETEPGNEAPDHTESQPAATEPSTARWAIRGAVVGAVAGSVAGAGVGVLVARRPEALSQAKGMIGGRAREIASAAAAAAATDVVTSRHLNQLVTADGSDRAEMVKQAATEAGVAAAKAARDSLISLRHEAVGS